jgi:hypothetical protein
VLPITLFLFIFLRLIDFPIFNFSLNSSNIPASPADGAYISQLIRYSRACAQYRDFLNRAQLPMQKAGDAGILLLLREKLNIGKVKSSIMNVANVQSGSSVWFNTFVIRLPMQKATPARLCYSYKVIATNILQSSSQSS